MKMLRDGKVLRHGMWAAVVTLGVFAGGCDSGKSLTGGAGCMPAGQGGMGGGSIGAGGGPGGASGGIALVDWVSDLAVNYTTEVSPPDTVTDKVIIDTDDPKAFDPLLNR